MQCKACILFACINGSCEEYKAAKKKDLNSYLQWFLRYGDHKFVPVHGIDEDEDAKNYLACNAVHEFYWLGKL